MSVVPIQLTGGTNPGRTPYISAKSTYNLFTSDNMIVSFPGYKKVLNIVNDYSSRAFFVSVLGDFMLTIMGDGVYKLIVEDLDTYTLAYQQVATLATTDGSVDIAENGNSEIGITDNLNFYVWNYNTGDFTVQDVQGLTPITATVSLSSIFIGGENSNTFVYSNPNQMVDNTGVNPTIPAFPIDNAGEIGSDKIVAVRQYKDLVYVYGNNSTRIWTDRGLDINPFQLDPTLVIEYGCLNKDSIAIGFGIMAWIAQSDDSNATLVASTGGEPESISTDGIDFLMSTLTTPEDCSAFIFQEDGHIFYVMTFKTDNLTLVYDFTSKEFLYVTDENFNAHIAKRIVRYKGKYFFTSYLDTSIYAFSSSFTTLDGNIIPRVLVSSPLRNDSNDFISLSNFSLQMEQGTTNSPMKVALSISKDGARTYSSPRSLPLQKLGRQTGLLKWNKLGISRDWTFQLRFYGEDSFIARSAEVLAV